MRVHQRIFASAQYHFKANRNRKLKWSQRSLFGSPSSLAHQIYISRSIHIVIYITVNKCRVYIKKSTDSRPYKCRVNTAQAHGFFGFSVVKTHELLCLTRITWIFIVFHLARGWFMVCFFLFRKYKINWLIYLYLYTAKWGLFELFVSFLCHGTAAKCE